MIHYLKPNDWIRYDHAKILGALAKAKATVLSLQTVPFQKRWVDSLQQLELKREVAGTSRIEGAEFTDRELDTAMRLQETVAQLHTRSQRQARAALVAYEWIKTVPNEQPVDESVILQIHRLMVTNADDDHCPPGRLRGQDDNVNFGSPKHRGVEGGGECAAAFSEFVRAIRTVFPGHDPLIQSIAAHYHFASMHPFLDGNGRTARALEALLLGRAGLRNTSFIAMSNYYHDEKIQYLATLASVRQSNHDLTDFILFALRGVELQAKRLLSEIQHEIKRELFVNLMMDLFYRLKSPRKRAISDRQVAILRELLGPGRAPIGGVYKRFDAVYAKLKNPVKAYVRDLNVLLDLGTISLTPREGSLDLHLVVNLDWPAEITETEFFDRITAMPKARVSWNLA